LTSAGAAAGAKQVFLRSKVKGYALSCLTSNLRPINQFLARVTIVAKDYNGITDFHPNKLHFQSVKHPSAARERRDRYGRC
jgi:hypothetical protein